MFILELQQKDGKPWKITLEGNLEIGRQRAGEPEPNHFLKGAGENQNDRIIIAGLSEAAFSRRQALIEPTGKNVFKLTNTSKKIWQVDIETTLDSGESCTRVAPFSFALQNKLFRIFSNQEPHQVDEIDLFESLSDHGSSDTSTHTILQQSSKIASFSENDFAEIVSWLQTTMKVFQSTIGSADFLAEAATALVDIVGLDTGRLLLNENGQYAIAAVHPPENRNKQWTPNKKILLKMISQRTAVWHSGEFNPNKTDLGNISSVAAPIYDSDGILLGALYGEKSTGQTQGRMGTLEALLVDILACGVATGLARQKHERDAASARVQFEQFFTPELANQLSKDPSLLKGKETEASLLFCDVRGFSRISERIGPEGTTKLMSSIFDEISSCVHKNQGVLVDYLGDGMLAMWGAPSFQPDHATKCIQAARQIKLCIPGLNEKWKNEIGEPISLGIGINSGKIWVGNTGSSIKFKYGPLGPAVNLASRVEGLTKYLRIPLLITGETKAAVKTTFDTRRLCKVRVVNMTEPVDIYQVFLENSDKHIGLTKITENALTELENGNFRAAAKIAGYALGDYPDDGPLLHILNRAVQEMVHPSNPYDPVWNSPGK